MDVNLARYRDRVGLDAEAVASADRTALQRLQRAHVRTIPWETLAIAGDPHGPHDGEPVSLTPAHLERKLIDRERGGFCYEHNALFERILDAAGFDVGVRAAKMLDDEGRAGTPAAHSTLVVALDGERVVADVGLGAPPMAAPVPLDGTAVTDPGGTEWRVRESDRPDADYATAFREPGEGRWTDRYAFANVDREWDRFAAVCEHFATAPESPFADGPSVSLATPEGYRKLEPRRLLERRGDRRIERPVDAAEWRATLRSAFGIDPALDDGA